VTLTVTAATKTYSFEGPFKLKKSSGDLRDGDESLAARSGVYLISTKAPDGKHRVLDVGESKDVRARLEGHDRKPCWVRNEADGLYVSVLYCDEAARMTLEGTLRTFFQPACGKA
jgi:hypothetical protein